MTAVITKNALTSDCMPYPRTNLPHRVLGSGSRPRVNVEAWEFIWGNLISLCLGSGACSSESADFGRPFNTRDARQRPISTWARPLNYCQMVYLHWRKRL